MFKTLQPDLSRILDVLPDGILYITPDVERKVGNSVCDYTLQYINTAAAAFLNLNGKSVMGQHLITDHLVDDPALEAIIVASDGPIKELYSDRLQKWLSVDKQVFDEGYLIRIADITHAREQQQRIEKLADRLKQEIDTSQAGSFYTSPIRNEEGVITDWVFNTANYTVAAFVNLKPEQLVGELGSKWFPAYMINGLFDRYVEVFTTGNTLRYDFHYYDEGKIDVWADFMITKVGEELLITLTDITTEKKLQLQLEASVFELTRMNESLKQFAAVASHDLQEPLRKINAYIDRLETKYESILDDEGFGYIERIKTASKRMRKLIQDLLVYAEVGSSKNAFEEINLDLLVQDAVSDLEIAIQERNGTVHFSQLGTIKGDPVHLQQLFQNLISNSLKYSKPNVLPEIWITSKPVMGSEIGLLVNETDQGKSFLAIQFKDNGQGFNQEQAHQIFKIFQRLPQHRIDYKGTGIGLAIVQRVVENHKGFIKAEGVNGVGASFTIYLPIL